MAFAAAEAEADAQYGYSGLGYSGLGHAGYAGIGGYSGIGHLGQGYSSIGHIGHGYSNLGHLSYGYAGPQASLPTSAAIAIRGYGTPATIGANAPYGYAASGQYRADSVGAVHIAKRSAEADAQYGYSGLGYSNLGYSGYAGIGGYSGIGHMGYSNIGHMGQGYSNIGLSSIGYSNLGHRSYGFAGPHAAPATSAGIAIRGYGTPATIGATAPYGYAASGQYRADSVGAVHIAKRSAKADAEPEADAYYSSYGYSGLGHSGYSGLGHRGYSGLRSSIGYGYSSLGHGSGYSSLGYGRSTLGHGIGYSGLSHATGYSSLSHGIGYSGINRGYSGIGYRSLGYSGYGR